jgi:1-aminocyclopropane-1-carboxylate deaminase
LEAQRRKNESILTFGGAYSNHLVATAKAGSIAGIQTIGMVRGEELNPNSNSTLKMCAEYGMKLKFISREEYALRNDKMYWEQLHEEVENTFIVPEGGANYYGLIGCQEIWKELPKNYFSHVYVAAGTGTTAAGLLVGLPNSSQLTAVSALKGDFMRKNIQDLLQYNFFDNDLVNERMEKLSVYEDVFFGGYAKSTPELTAFMQWTLTELDLPLDKVYTAKAFYQLLEHIKQQKLVAGDKVLFIHTGGLQGN